MKREQLTEKLLDIKRERGWSWKHICDAIGGLSPVLIVGALLGQMKLTKPLAQKAATLFGLSIAEQRLLNEIPTRGTSMPPNGLLSVAIAFSCCRSAVELRALKPVPT